MNMICEVKKKKEMPHVTLREYDFIIIFFLMFPVFLIKILYYKIQKYSKMHFFFVLFIMVTKNDYSNSYLLRPKNSYLLRPKNS